MRSPDVSLVKFTISFLAMVGLYQLAVSPSLAIGNCGLTNQYDYASGRRLIVASDASLKEPALVFQPKQKLYLGAQADEIKEIRLARLRLLLPDGRIYKQKQLTIKDIDGARWFWAEVELDHDFKLLNLDVEILANNRRRSRRQDKQKQIFFWRGLVASNLDFLPKTKVGSFKDSFCLAFGRQIKIMVHPLSPNKPSQIKAVSFDDKKNNIKLDEAKLDVVDGLWQVELAVDKADKTGWYSFSFTITDDKNKKFTFSLPLYLLTDKVELRLEKPEAGQKLTDEEVVAGHAKTELKASLDLWLQSMSDSQTDKWQLVASRQLDTGQVDGELFVLNTKDLSAGDYNLKVKLQNQAGSQAEVKIDNLVKPPNIIGSLRLFSTKTLDLPKIVVSTFDQIVSRQIGEGDSQLVINDGRRPSPGWSLTARFDSLYSAQADHYIQSINLLTVQPTEIVPLKGDQSLTGIHLGPKTTIDKANQEVIISWAEAGSGFGWFSQKIAIEWVIPANTPAGDYYGSLILTLQ